MEVREPERHDVRLGANSRKSSVYGLPGILQVRPAGSQGCTLTGNRIWASRRRVCAVCTGREQEANPPGFAGFQENPRIEKRRQHRMDRILGILSFLFSFHSSWCAARCVGTSDEFE